MFDVLLAALLAQTTPEPDATATPAAPANASPAADLATPLPADAPGGVRTFPRGPRRLPIETPAMTTGDALIRNSGSTNTAGYLIVVHPDGTADIPDGRGGSVRKTVGAAQAKWLFAKLKEAAPFGATLGGGHCMKSASFGSYTTIVYDGETTPDLQCPGGAQSQELGRTIRVIVDQLGISTRRVPGMLRL